MSDLRIEVVGADEIRALLRQAEGPGMLRQLGYANKEASEEVAREAARTTPVRTGRLVGSVRALGSQRAGRVRAGSASVPYAAAIHWGRKIGNVGRPPGNHLGPNRIVGRRYLWDAAQKAQQRVVETYRRAIERLVDSIGA